MQKAASSTEEGEHFKMRGRRTDRSMMDFPAVIINHMYMLHLQEKAKGCTCCKTQRPKKTLPQNLLYYLYLCPSLEIAVFLLGQGMLKLMT